MPFLTAYTSGSPAFSGRTKSADAEEPTKNSVVVSISTPVARSVMTCRRRLSRCAGRGRDRIHAVVRLLRHASQPLRHPAESVATIIPAVRSPDLLEPVAQVEADQVVVVLARKLDRLPRLA